MPRSVPSAERSHVSGRRRSLVESWALLVALALLSAPLVAACIWLYGDRFAPIYDMALFEMRVRDVGTLHTPLTGLGGRLARWPEVGCHPGPLGFYVLAPVYRLLGGSYWALRTSIVTLAVATTGGTLLLARRRGGTPGVVAVGVVIALIELGFGLQTLTEPWNPYVPVLWFVAFLVSVWSVLAGDVRLLPVVAALGTLCGQTHIPYLPVCGGLSALTFSFVVGRWIHARRRWLPSRELGRSCVVTVATTVVLWLPPVLDELTRKRGNFTILLEHFRNPPEPLVGLGPAVPHVLGHLDVWFLLTESMRHPGHLRAPWSTEPTVTGGAITMLLWLVSAGLALRVRERNLLALHATVAASLTIALVAISRIVGFPYKYVLLFGWSMGGLTLLSIAWTVACLVQRRARSSAIPGRLAAVLGLVLIGTFAARLTTRVRDAGSGDPTSALQLGTLVAPTVQAIRGRAGASVGPGGPYLVTWEDALYGGGHGYALLNELERHGIRAFISDGVFFRSVVGAHRVIAPKRARARIHIANGDWIFEARKIRGATEIAYSDIRTPALRKEYDECVANLAQALRDVGRPDMIPRIERSVGATNVPGLGWAALGIARISEIGMPEAVFVLPK